MRERFARRPRPNPLALRERNLWRAGGVERVHVGARQRKLGCAHEALGLFD